MPIQTITTPAGDELIVLSRQEYQDLIDARDHAAALRDVASGAMETLNETELDVYLTAPSPLAFWRKRRGLTQARLARLVEISQGFLAQIETGKRIGEVGLYLRLAKTLNIRMEDLVTENVERDPTSDGSRGSAWTLRPRGGYFAGEGHQFELQTAGAPLWCGIEDDAFVALAGRKIRDDADAKEILVAHKDDLLLLVEKKQSSVGNLSSPGGPYPITLEDVRSFQVRSRTKSVVL